MPKRIAGEPERVNLAEAARMTGLTVRNLQRMTLRGEVPGAGRPRGTRSWTFGVAELRAWMVEWEQPLATLGNAPAKRLKLSPQPTTPHRRMHVPGESSGLYEDAKRALFEAVKGSVRDGRLGPARRPSSSAKEGPQKSPHRGSGLTKR